MGPLSLETVLVTGPLPHLLISSAALSQKTLPPPAEAPSAPLLPTAALAHPLPAGMRDGLPPEARAQTELIRRILGSFELHGYELVIVPMFEYAEVLERGLGAFELSEVLRFVEPETGAVVALRPDMTPQVARLLATRLADAPLPALLEFYRAELIRQRAVHLASWPRKQAPVTVAIVVVLVAMGAANPRIATRLPLAAGPMLLLILLTWKWNQNLARRLDREIEVVDTARSRL